MEMLDRDIIAIVHHKVMYARVKLIIIGISKVYLEICAMIIMDLIVMGIMLMVNRIGVKINHLLITF